ncbi:MAG: DNA-directed RNA polymerase subunit P [Nanoarchaeota archaeon]
MATYKCFQCDKQIKKEYLKKKIRCPYCGSKILFKPRMIPTTLPAE